MPVGEAILGAFLSVLFDRLTSPELWQFASREGIQSKLKKWEKTLKMIDALLVDADEKQLKQRTVQTWLDDLQDLAYDVEDMLDEFATEGLRRKLTAHDHASTSKVRDLIPACFTACTPAAFKFNVSMGSKINAISSQLDELYEQRIGLGLQIITGGTSAPAWNIPPTTSVPTEPAVCGRDGDKAKVLEMVLRDEPSHVNFGVIPIVGMGGLGKTTLARQVFNDKAVEDFNPRAWVCISDEFDILRISKALLESIAGSCDLKELDPVQVKLKNALAGKKFLLVLDDVWSRDYRLWESLKSPFMAGAPGSKIIVTTRSKDVALTVGQSEYFELKLLKEDDCWAIFEKHVYGNKVISTGRNVKLIREKVVEKCKGLPLAARTLGGILRSKQRHDEWMDILNSKIWDSSESSDQILPVLNLSYHHLPSHLKRCFAYCAIFPKDYEFIEMELILLWMAEGLIRESKNKPLEDVGREYFQDLLLRSIFQQSNIDVSKFVMHDLVNDLAQSVSGETSFNLEDQLNVRLQSKRYERIRHSSYSRKRYEVKNKFEIFQRVDKLRTFLPLWTSGMYGEAYISNTVFPELLAKLKKLRVLSLANYCIVDIPDSIGGLTHLRYLNLSNTKIRALPEPTSSLYNLQILILNRCRYLKKLPFNIGNLINLRHLDISNSPLIKEMSLGMSKLKCLRILSDFIVGKGIGSSLKELKDLKFLSGKLVISNLENVVDSQERKESILNDKKELKVLVLQWSPNFDPSRNIVVEENVLNMVQPHANLEELIINNYGGQKFPTWLGNSLLSKMVVLQLDGCENCVTLPSLGQLGSLKTLAIKNMKNLNKIGSEIYGVGCLKSFQSLEKLYFENLPEWEHWNPMEENEHAERFPHLQNLSISRCPKLSGRLPQCLPLLEKLVISECEQLVVSFSKLPVRLCSLEINRCKGIVCSIPNGSKSLNAGSCENLNFPVFKNWPGQIFQKIEKLTIVGCDELVRLWPNEIYPEKPPQGFHDLTSLKELYLHELPNLISVPDGFLSIPSKLEIIHCNALTSLHEGLKHNNPRLERLKLEGCPSLTIIVRGHLPSSLKELWVRDCKNLSCIMDDREDSWSTFSPSSSCSMMHKENVDKTSTSLLNNLSIFDCPSLTCLSTTDQPSLAALRHLHIESCSNLKILFPREQLSKALNFIWIRECPKLESIVDRFDDNTPLEEIWITKCENLKSIPEGLHTLSSLQEFNIWDCPSLLLFPEGGHPNTPSGNCEKLQALSHRMHTLNSLQHLGIGKCPSVLSFSVEGIPASLTSLVIGDVNFYNHLTEWGFHKLTSLRKLYICDGCVDAVCFPQEDIGKTLPSSLIDLTLRDLPKLKYLSSKAFQNLSSLQSLRIANCSDLTSLPSLPSSLESLSIYDCPNVKSLPSLPSSLLQLYIRNCPMLKKLCKRAEGQEWSKIAHIPRVEIDGKCIYDPEEEE